MTPLTDVLFWKREYWNQRARIEGIGTPTDLAGEWAFRDAEYAMHEAWTLYRDKLLSAWAARITGRAAADHALHNMPPLVSSTSLGSENAA